MGPQQEQRYVSPGLGSHLRELPKRVAHFTTRWKGRKEGIYSQLVYQSPGRLPFACLHETLVYKQDNSSIQTAKRTLKWFRDNAIDWIQDWPPYSPGLDPIEHIWPLLKEKVYELYPDIQLWSGGQESLAASMEDRLVHAWDCVRPQIIENCARSMPESRGGDQSERLVHPILKLCRRSQTIVRYSSANSAYDQNC